MIIGLLTLTPGKNLSGLFIWEIPGMDKVAHAGFYAVLSWLVFFPFLPAFRKNVNKTTLWIILLVVFGALMELLQYYVPNRTLDLVDILANTVGIFFGRILATFFRKWT